MNSAIQKCFSKGLKLTPQRIAIFEYLERSKEHPSAEDIYKAMLERFPTMSCATVYNTLTVLKSHGLVSELTIDGDRKRFDADMSLHNHLICSECRCVVDLHARFDLKLNEEEAKGFSILGSHVDFYGVCPKCQELNVNIDKGGKVGCV